MWTSFMHLVHGWSGLYSDSALTRSLVGFAHVGGLLVGGGYALAEDRRILTAGRRVASAVQAGSSAHHIVLGGLGLVMTSGLLLFAADAEFYGRSPAFWIKMGLVAALLANGWALRRAEAEVLRSSDAGRGLRRAAAVSAILWLLTTLAGSVLPNV